MKDKILSSLPAETLKIHIAMIARSEVFSLPPHGHVGCYASIDPFMGAMPGRIVEFHTEAGLAGEGVIVFTEQPGSCVRPDMAQFENWYKLHWVPINHDLLEQQLLRINGVKCPKCGGDSKVTETRRPDGKLIRKRRCLKCKPTVKWRTAEIYAGEIANNAGRPKESTARRRHKQPVSLHRKKVQPKG